MEQNRRRVSEPVRKQGWVYSLSFFLPALVMLLVYISLGFYPFGEKSLLTADMYGQYTCFISYLKDMPANGNDLFYTFSKSLGGDMFGFAAYYLLSPFNWIALFFSTRDLPQAMMLITLLKTGAADLTFSVFAARESGFRKGIPLFSAGYALMAFMFVYQQNILWLDAVIGLPLVLLGIHRLVTEKKPLLYAVSLGLCLAVNYYTGYILCLFAVLYFLYKAVMTTAFTSKEGRHACCRAAVRFALSSLLAAGLAAVILLPTAFSLQGGDKNTQALSHLTLDSRFHVPDMLSKLHSNAFEGADLWTSNLPSIFCGVLTVGMVLLFFMNRQIRIREKLAAAGMLAVMTGSCQLDGVYLLWHGFNNPVGFPCRQAFLISFLLLYFGYRCYVHLGGTALRHLGYALVLYGALTLLTGQADRPYLEAASLWMDFLLLCLLAGLLAAVLLFPHLSARAKSWLLLGALVLQSANLLCNGRDTLSQIPYYSQSAFTGYVDAVQPVINRVKEEDNSFYRLEKTFQRDHNDPMLLSYRGLSHFSSTEKTATKKFLERLGLRNNGNWVYYNQGSTIAADSLLGVKYLLARSRPNACYDELFTENGITVYRNPYALPLGFMAADAVDGVDPTGDNPFAFQNRIFAAMTGQGDLFVREENVTRSLHGLTEAGAGRYTVTGEGVAEFTFTAARTDPLYVYLPADQLKRAAIAVNGRELGDYFDIRRYDVVYLGQFDSGEKVTFTVRALEDALYFRNAYFYYEDMERTAAVTQSLASHPYTIDQFTSSHLTGTVTVPEGRERLVTTIPADEGWTVRVDGQKAEPVKVLDAVWSVPLTPGTHTVEWRFVPKGFPAGAAVTAACLLGILAWIGWPRIRRHIQAANKTVPPENREKGTQTAD